MIRTYSVDTDKISVSAINMVLNSGAKLSLSVKAQKRIKDCRKYLEKKLTENNKPIYGVNTGFGSLCNIRISDSDLEKLQENLVLSHSCGMGGMVPVEITKLMLLLKVKSFAYGHSGISIEVVNRLMQMYNHNVIPCVYEQGSLGASGDLAPLAHLSLPLIGKGEVFYKGNVQKSKDVLKMLGWKPIALKAKEGIALLNGTQFMSAYGVFCLSNAIKLMEYAEIISAISSDAFDCNVDPFDKLIQKVKPYKGQIHSARLISNYLKGSQLSAKVKDHVQDPYSFRCIPQVHGAVRDVIDFVKNIFDIEINAVSDNPLVFPDEDKILSGGNFHGEPLAMAFDQLCIALSELGNISERRIFKLISGERGLPVFLTGDSGINSGLMIPQYTAAAIVSENKQLCTPCSVDSIVSSNGQEDHVSMGANAAVKAMRVVNNLRKILAIELFTAAQAMDFRKPLKTSPLLEKFITNFRKSVPSLKNDRLLKNDLDAAVKFLS